MKDRRRSKERRVSNERYPDELRDRLLACMGLLRKSQDKNHDVYRYYGVTRGMVTRHKQEYAFLQMRLSYRIDYMGLNYENAMFDALVKLYARWNRPFSRGTVMALAQKLKQELIVKYDQGTGPVPGPTLSWLSRLEERFPEIALGRSGHGIDLVLREGEVKIWHKKLEEIAEEVPARNFGVMSVNGYHFSRGGEEGVRTVMNVGSEPPDLDNGDHLALYECVLASGDVIPPLAVFISKGELPFEEESVISDLETDFWGGKLEIARCDSYEEATRRWVFHYDKHSDRLAEEGHKRCLVPIGDVPLELEQTVYAETEDVLFMSPHRLAQGAFDPLRTRYFNLTKRFVNNLELSNIFFGGEGLAANELVWLSFYHTGAEQISISAIKEGFEMAGLYPLRTSVMTDYLFPGRNDRIEVWSTTTNEAIQAELLRNCADDGEFTNALADFKKVLQYLVVAAPHFLGDNGTDFQDIKVKIMDARSYVLTSYTLQEISDMEKDEDLRPKIRDCFVDILSSSDKGPVRGLNSKPRITTKQRHTKSRIKEEEDEEQKITLKNLGEITSSEIPRLKRSTRNRTTIPKHHEESPDSDLADNFLNTFDSGEDSSFKLSDDDQLGGQLSSPPQPPKVSSPPVMALLPQKRAVSPRKQLPDPEPQIEPEDRSNGFTANPASPKLKHVIHASSSPHSPSIEQGTGSTAQIPDSRRRLSFDHIHNKDQAVNPPSPKLKHVIPASSSPLSPALEQQSGNESALSSPPPLSPLGDDYSSDHDIANFNFDIEHEENELAVGETFKPNNGVSHRYATPPGLPDDDIVDTSMDERWIRIFENIYGDAPSIERLKSEIPLLYHLSRSASRSARSTDRRISTSNGFEGTPLEFKRSTSYTGDLSSGVPRMLNNRSPRRSMSALSDLSYVNTGESTPVTNGDRRGSRIYNDSPALEGGDSPKRKRRKLSQMVEPSHKGGIQKNDVPESILGVKVMDAEDGRSLTYRTAWRNNDEITYEPLSTFKQYPRLVKEFYDRNDGAEKPKELRRFLEFSLFLHKPTKK